jgi:hypothetical protein
MFPGVLVALAMLSAGLQAATLPPTLQEQAEFLAGIPLPGGSILSPLQRTPEYRAHRKRLQEEWDFCRGVRYEPMRRWATDHLSRYPATRGVLRYLFGGPDFLNAYAFFPDTRVMVLGGLEPVGDVPPPGALAAAGLGPALAALDEALHTSLFCGYFITSEMKPRLARGTFRGVLPVLFTELALTGNVIDSVSMEKPFGSPGVLLTYHRPGGPPQSLWYFQADLSNGEECRRFLSWLGKQGPGASYLKAASYLLPLDSFSDTRNFLIRTSDLILQDDSGLPYRSFLPGEWRISLYGAYTDPLPIFNLRREPGLVEAYDSPLRIGPLPFGAGYHVNATDANLLLAIRSNQPPEEALPSETAPAAVAAFSSPTPKPKRIPVRKALPVTVRKALPVTAPSPEVSPAMAIPPPATETAPATLPSPGLPYRTPEPDSLPATLTGESPVASPVPEEVAPGGTTPAQAEPDPASPAPDTAAGTLPGASSPPPAVPLTSGGKPID